MAIVMTLTYITHPNGDSHLAAIRACEAGGKICWLSGRKALNHIAATSVVADHYTILINHTVSYYFFQAYAYIAYIDLLSLLKSSRLSSRLLYYFSIGPRLDTGPIRQ